MEIPIERLFEVERRLLRFERRSKLVADLTVLWQCSTSTIDNYIRRVRDGLEAQREIELPRRRALMRAVGEHGMATSYQMEDPRAAAVFYDRLCKLDGLFAPEKIEHEHTGAVGHVIDIANPEAVRARVEELQRRIAERRASEAAALPAKGTAHEA